MLVVFAYDIPDNERRNMVAKLLEGYGFRVQKSVFECFLEEDRIKQVVKEVLEVLDESQDNLRVYRLCKACESKRGAYGIVGLLKEQNSFII